MRALIDADIVSTPIGQCVVLPPLDHLRHAQSCWCLNDSAQCCRPSCHCALSAGDVLAVVEAADGPCSQCGRKRSSWDSECRCGITTGGLPPTTGHVRRGFVRVLKVLPVVDGDILNPPWHPDHFTVSARTQQCWLDSQYEHNLPIHPSPGDVVLVVEPWCETCEGEGYTVNSLIVPPDRIGQHCPDCTPTPVAVTHRDGVLGEIGEPK